MNPEPVLALLLDPDPLHHQQGVELLSALPELHDALFGPEGALWQDMEAGVLKGLQLLHRHPPIPQHQLWAWGVESMAQAGPLPWQRPRQHREDLHAIQHWAADEFPPFSLRDISRKALWMVQRHHKRLNSTPAAALWPDALERHTTLPNHLRSFEFIADTLEDEPGESMQEILEDELHMLGQLIRPALAELLVLVHLLMFAQESRQQRQQATLWHQHHLGPMLKMVYNDA